MKPHKQRVINLKVDIIYKAMSFYALRKERAKIKELYKEWKTMKNRAFTPIIIGHRISNQILLHNADRINDFISTYNIPKRFESCSPNQVRRLETIKRKICIHTDSPFDSILITTDELLKLNLQSKLF